MTQYAIINPAGAVVGLVDSDTEPEIIGDNIARALAEAVPCVPEKKFPGFTLICPVDTLEWRDDRALAQARLDKITDMDDACKAQIAAGFVSSALGSEHLYPANPQDQANLVASVTDSLLAGADPLWTTSFWCRDADGVWAFTPHTIVQIQQVGREGKAAILAALAHNDALRQQIEVADAAGLDAIDW